MATEQDLDQSYAVMEWLAETMRQVAGDPRLLGGFLYEYSKQLSETLDALMVLLPPEHRGIVSDVLRASGEMTTGVLVWLAKK